MYEKERVERLLNAVESYMGAEGVCPHAYDDTVACLEDGCHYCTMVRAYLEIRRPQRRDDEVQKM
jgi:hypothetical protein